MKSGVTIRGMEDVVGVLNSIAPREARNLARSTVHASAGIIRDDAKRFMPSDTGVMKKSTKAVRRNIKDNILRSDVLVTAAAFYWRFREYGQGPDMREDAMFMKAVALFRQDMDKVFAEQFGKKLEARLARLAKR